MATADEILAGMAEETEETAQVCTIDLTTRSIDVPDSLRLAGVESDEGVRRLYFEMPRMDGTCDLGAFSIRINYLNARGEGDVYIVSDAQAGEKAITFSWLLGRSALAYRGSIRFIVCLRQRQDEEWVKEWNTTVATLDVLEGLETDEAVVQQHPDIIEHILSQLSEGTVIATARRNLASAGEEAHFVINASSGTLIAYNQIYGLAIPLGEHTGTTLTIRVSGNSIFRLALLPEKPVSGGAYRMMVSNDTLSEYTVAVEPTDQYLYFAYASLLNGDDPAAIRPGIAVYYDVWEDETITAGSLLRAWDAATNRRARSLFAAAAARPILTVIDDDTLTVASVTKFHDLMSAFGVQGTYATITAEIEKPDNAGLPELLLGYEKEGFHCCLHANLQQPYYTEESRDMAAAQADFITAKRKMHSYGFADPDFFVTPYGVVDAPIQQMARRWGMHCAVSIGQKTYEDTAAVNGRFALARVIFNQTDDAQNTWNSLKAVMDEAFLNEGWLLVGTHLHMWDEAAGYARFNQMIQYAQSLGFEILPLNEAWRIREPIYRLYEAY